MDSAFMYVCVCFSLCMCVKFKGPFLLVGTDCGCSQDCASHLLKVHFIWALEISDDTAGSPQRNHNNINVPAGERTSANWQVRKVPLWNTSTETNCNLVLQVSLDRGAILQRRQDYCDRGLGVASVVDLGPADGDWRRGLG